MRLSRRQQIEVSTRVISWSCNTFRFTHGGDHGPNANRRFHRPKPKRTFRAIHRVQSHDAFAGGRQPVASGGAGWTNVCSRSRALAARNCFRTSLRISSRRRACSMAACFSAVPGESNCTSSYSSGCRSRGTRRSHSAEKNAFTRGKARVPASDVVICSCLRRARGPGDAAKRPKCRATSSAENGSLAGRIATISRRLFVALRRRAEHVRAQVVAIECVIRDLLPIASAPQARLPMPVFDLGDKPLGDAQLFRKLRLGHPARLSVFE